MRLTPFPCPRINGVKMIRKRKSRYEDEIEEGNFTGIPNKILEVIYQQDFFLNQSKIFWFIVRKTWGWKKDREIISLKMFSENTNLSKISVCETLRELQQRRIITKNGKNIYAIQMDTSKWRPKTGKAKIEKLPQTVRKITADGNAITAGGNKFSLKRSPKANLQTPKQTILKETILKENNKSKKLAKERVVSSKLRFSGEERNEIVLWFVITPGWKELSKDKLYELIDIAISKGKKGIREYFRLWKRAIDKKRNIHTTKTAYLISMIKQGFDPPGYQLEEK